MTGRRIVLLGATGFTGNRVLRKLLAAGATPTLVGRNGAKMSAAAAHLGVELPVVDVDMTSTADLKRVFTSNDVVLSTVGPFMKLGLATAAAAARAGAHYLDSTGEATFVRRVFDLDSVAAAQGAALIPAFGYDYVPGNLAGALAVEQAGDRATQVEVGYFLTRSGFGDELRYRSTLRDVYTLTTGEPARPWWGHRPRTPSPIGRRDRVRRLSCTRNVRAHTPAPSSSPALSAPP
jgi:short subunit dehydrogenase-like uncharacterized protein